MSVFESASLFIIFSLSSFGKFSFLDFLCVFMMGILTDHLFWPTSTLLLASSLRILTIGILTDCLDLSLSFSDSSPEDSLFFLRAALCWAASAITRREVIPVSWPLFCLLADRDRDCPEGGLVLIVLRVSESDSPPPRWMGTSTTVTAEEKDDTELETEEMELLLERVLWAASTGLSKISWMTPISSTSISFDSSSDGDVITGFDAGPKRTLKSKGSSCSTSDNSVISRLSWSSLTIGIGLQLVDSLFCSSCLLPDSTLVISLSSYLSLDLYSWHSGSASTSVTCSTPSASMNTFLIVLVLVVTVLVTFLTIFDFETLDSGSQSTIGSAVFSCSRSFFSSFTPPPIISLASFSVNCVERRILPHIQLSKSIQKLPEELLLTASSTGSRTLPIGSSLPNLSQSITLISILRGQFLDRPNVTSWFQTGVRVFFTFLDLDIRDP